MGTESRDREQPRKNGMKTIERRSFVGANVREECRASSARNTGASPIRTMWNERMVEGSADRCVIPGEYRMPVIDCQKVKLELSEQVGENAAK